MNALINIGLVRTMAEEGGYLRVRDIYAAFDAEYVEGLRHRIELGEHEDTFVAHVANWTEDKGERIARALDQECIAQYDLDECKGRLVGPLAEKWGKFDPKFFKIL
jgi:hypothetical protein